MAAHSGAEIGVHSPAKPVGEAAEAAEPAAVEPEAAAAPEAEGGGEETG